MNKVIVQLPVNEATDFDQLIYVEEKLIQAFMLDRIANVDGHHIGQGRFNIFIHLEGDWEPVLERVSETLAKLGLLDKAIVAKLPDQTNRYEVVSPDAYVGNFEP